MRALAITGEFGVERLQWIELPQERPGPRQVRVRMLAAAINFRDMQVIGGLRQVPTPLVPLSDACAEVVETGEGVTRFKVGDRVMPVFAPGWHSGPQPQGDTLMTLGGPLQGTLREEAVWHEEDVVAAPAFLTDMEAAALPCAAVSAWNALFVAAAVRPGDRVLLQGTGGVSLFALQFAKAAGASAVLISSSDEKLEKARALGADVAINYRRRPDWGKAVLDEAGPVDCVVEVGGSGTLEQSILCLKNAGHISFVGFLSGTVPQFDLGEISRKSVRIQGIRVGNRDSFEAMCRAIVSAGIRPAIGATAKFGEARQALANFRDGDHFGKVCLAF